jgi:hypothetical protein
MPCGPRLDAPGTLPRVMVRGIERTALFDDRRDPTDFLAWRRPIPAPRALRCAPACTDLPRVVSLSSEEDGATAEGARRAR